MDSPAAKALRRTLLAGSPSLRPGTNSNEAGFTLVEMMTVLVIVGLMSSAVILTLPPTKPALEMQAEIFLKDANALSQTSLISGRPQALGLSHNGYALMSFETGQWETIRQVDFTGAIEPKLIREDMPMKLSGDIVPLVLFEATGLSTPFELTLSDGDRRTRLQSQGDGRVVIGSGS